MRSLYKVSIIIFVLFSSTIVKPVEAENMNEPVTYPGTPTDGIFVYDYASILTNDSRSEIQKISEESSSEEGIPIVVVTITKMSDYNWWGTIESYAAMLFNNWGIGYEDYNYGMLLLISVEDREARIELGYEWAGTINDDCEVIMQNIIVSNFKDGKYDEGTVKAVDGLFDVAKGDPINALSLKLFGTTSFPVYFWLLAAIVILVLVFSIRDMSENGDSGWGKNGLKATGFVCILFLLYAISMTIEDGPILIGVILSLGLPLFFGIRADLGGGGGGGYSGGSRSWSGGGGFSGGYSGGGGSTGRW